MIPSCRYFNSAPASRCAGLALVLLLAGCAGGGSAPGPAPDVDGDAVAVVPDAVAKRYADAQTLVSVEDYAGAAAILEEVVAANPQFPGAATTLAMSYRKLDRRDDALALLETTLATHDTYAPGWNEVGILHREAGRFDAAEAAYLKAVTVNPDYALAHFNFGILLDLYLAQHERALEHYQRYQELVPDEDQQVAGWIADISRRIQRSTRAAQVQ